MLLNRTVIRICRDTTKMTTATPANWLKLLIDDTTSPLPALCSKMCRVAKRASKLRGDQLEAYKNEPFVLPSDLSAAPERLYPITESPSRPPTPTHQPIPPPTATSKRLKIESPIKKLHLMQYQFWRKEKQILGLDAKLLKLKEELDAKTKDKSMYSIRNVKRRDQRNAEIKASLRSEKNRLAALVQEREKENVVLKSEIEILREENSRLARKVLRQTGRIRRSAKEKKRALNRANYHKKRRLVEKRQNGKEKAELNSEDDFWIEVDLKTSDGEFSEEARFCVLELTGLEVGTGNIGKVMETVGDMCGLKFKSLPKRTACQNIIDEGQILAKSFINQKVLKRCSSFGVHKDGTTRRKVKILDTSVQTEEGETFCLGWSSVASETGRAIADDTIEKLGEVLDDSVDSVDMRKLLQKLEYYMNDRAANEKKSCDLLDEWREEMLAGENIPQKAVKHLHCAAHVLLGFHTYVLSSLSKLEIIPRNELKHPIATLLRDASDVFAPVGDYRGLRQQWEGLCIERGIKSIIKLYKDNRFNGLFEIAAQVYHHHQEFIYLLESNPAKNNKQAKVYQGLKDPILLLLIQCLGLFFQKVTGPFWTMVISKTTHKTFRSTLLEVKNDLQKCQENPSFFFKPECFSEIMKFPITSPTAVKNLPKKMGCPNMRIIIGAISEGILNTLKAQLKDVLEATDAQNVKAPLTNLSSERHFGHLDSSQRRRPHCSLHHHSSVILLKQTRKRLREWFYELPNEEKERMWKRAKRQGKEMRHKHQERDRAAVMQSLKLRTKRVRNNGEEDEDEDDSGMAYVDGALKEEQMIAVACEDTWYPGKPISLLLTLNGKSDWTSFIEYAW